MRPEKVDDEAKSVQKASIPEAKRVVPVSNGFVAPEETGGLVNGPCGLRSFQRETEKEAEPGLAAVLCLCCSLLTQGHQTGPLPPTTSPSLASLEPGPMGSRPGLLGTHGGVNHWDFPLPPYF